VLRTRLCHRGDAIALLAARFLGEFAHAPGGRQVELSPEALDTLVHYDWPGNVRDLRNVLERATIVSEDEVIQPHDLSLWPVPLALGDTTDLGAIEQRTVERAMRDADGNKKKAARLLRISQDAL